MSSLAVRALIATSTACAGAVSFYALVRGGQLALFPEANPATVLWSAHSGYFWRIWIVVYLAGMAAFIAYLAARRDPLRAATAISRLVVVSALAIVIQAIFAP